MGQVYRFAKLRFWAETGLVKIVDELDGSYRVVDPREFLKRAQAMHDQGQRSHYLEERLFYKRLSQQMVDCAQEALQQGSPFEPGVTDFYRRHKSYGQPQSFVIDGKQDQDEARSGSSRPPEPSGSSEEQSPKLEGSSETVSG